MIFEKVLIFKGLNDIIKGDKVYHRVDFVDESDDFKSFNTLVKSTDDFLSLKPDTKVNCTFNLFKDKKYNLSLFLNSVKKI